MDFDLEMVNFLGLLITLMTQENSLISNSNNFKKNTMKNFKKNDYTYTVATAIMTMAIFAVCCIVYYLQMGSRD